METVRGLIVGWIVLALGHVVAFSLVPVEWVLSTLRAVRGRGRAVSRNFGLAQRLGLIGYVGDLAPESGHVVLLRPGIVGVDPEPCAMAILARASRHLRRDLVGGVGGPGAGSVNGEDDKVLGLDGADIGFVNDGDGSSLDVGVAGSVDASVIAGAVAFSGSWAGIAIGLTDVGSALGACPIGS